MGPPAGIARPRSAAAFGGGGVISINGLTARSRIACPPAKMRAGGPGSPGRRFGIKNGGAVILEERDNELVLKPAMVLEVEMYADEQVSAWDDAERQSLLRRLAARQ